MANWAADCLAAHNSLRAKHGAGRSSQFQQNVFPLGTKPPHEEEEEERECSEPEYEEESSDDGFNAGEGGEKGNCRKYEDHTNAFTVTLYFCVSTQFIIIQCLVHTEALVGHHHHGAMRQEVK